MRLWRLSSERRARDFDGGYGVSNDGRWNTRGRPVTYCSTVPSLAALEKRVHVTDPTLLPPQVMVAYELPDGISRRTIDIQTFRRTGRHTRRTHRPLVIGGSIRWQRSCFSSLQSSCQLQTRSIAMYSSIIGQRALLRSKLRRSRHSQSIRDYSDHNGTVELVRRQRGDRSLDEAYADSSDYIIVGAGTAGCVLAN